MMIPNQSNRILIVEDDPQFARLVERMLTHAGYDSEHAASAEVARDRIASEHFDVAICDLGLPGDGGLSLARELQITRPDLAVIIATGTDTPDMVREAFTYGAHDYLVKPFSEPDLVLSVSRALRRVQAKGAGRGSTTA